MIPQTPNSDQEEMRYGPFSDGEADRVMKKPGGMVGGTRGGRGRARRQSTSSYCSSSNVVDFPPHYVTLSRATLDQMSREANGYIGYRHQQFEHRQIQVRLF